MCVDILLGMWLWLGLQDSPCAFVTQHLSGVRQEGGRHSLPVIVASVAEPAAVAVLCMCLMSRVCMLGQHSKPVLNPPWLQGPAACLCPQPQQQQQQRMC